MRTRSFASHDTDVITAANGQIGHRDHIDHLDVIRANFYTVRPGVWCVVGNGLSNQTFIEAPEGIIAIDTGESVEEMQDAIDLLRTVTDRPIVAVIYTHFHYVGGTTAVNGTADASVPVLGHARITVNLARTAGELAPAYSRGLVEQFGTALPLDGPDGIIHCGLGHHLRNPAHAPYTHGFVPPTATFDSPTELDVAGLAVHVQPAPSDADDSVTLWFPTLSVAVQNLVWPTLFNVFAIRGEEYRDPRILLSGIDHLLGLEAEHLVGAHGPPLSGRTEIAERVTKYRDSIQFLWDQTVRGINAGLTSEQLAHTVALPDQADEDYLTSERYGVAEHHTRQIHIGLRGWFDGDPARLFPLPPTERATRLIAGFGGHETVRAQTIAALEANDLRWATELASWLVRSPDPSLAEGDLTDRSLLARALRLIGQRSPAANIRNWCLTNARDLDGTGPMDRYRVHRFRRGDVLKNPAGAFTKLRVLVDPKRAANIDHRAVFQFAGHQPVTVHLRNSVLVQIAEPAAHTSAAHSTVSLDPSTWFALLTKATTWDEATANGSVVVDGDATSLARLIAAFDLPS